MCSVGNANLRTAVALPAWLLLLLQKCNNLPAGAVMCLICLFS